MVIKRLMLIWLLFHSVVFPEGFAPSTLVKTPSGYTPIVRLSHGDSVITHDGIDYCTTQVIARSFKMVDSYVAITGHALSSEDAPSLTINVDTDHLIYCANHSKWTKASDLEKGDLICSGKEGQIQIDTITQVPMRALKIGLSLKDHHTYFVSSSDVMVHNFTALRYLRYDPLSILGVVVELTSKGLVISPYVSLFGIAYCVVNVARYAGDWVKQRNRARALEEQAQACEVPAIRHIAPPYTGEYGFGEIAPPQAGDIGLDVPAVGEIALPQTVDIGFNMPDTLNPEFPLKYYGLERPSFKIPDSFKTSLEKPRSISLGLDKPFNNLSHSLKYNFPTHHPTIGQIFAENAGWIGFAATLYGLCRDIMNQSRQSTRAVASSHINDASRSVSVDTATHVAAALTAAREQIIPKDTPKIQPPKPKDEPKKPQNEKPEHPKPPKKDGDDGNIPITGAAIAAAEKVAEKIEENPEIVETVQEVIKKGYYFSKEIIEKAIDKVISNANTLRHIFENNKHDHNLEQLIKYCGGKLETISAVLRAANGHIEVDETGVFTDIPVGVGNFIVYIRGRVIQGIPRLSTMFIKK